MSEQPVVQPTPQPVSPAPAQATPTPEAVVAPANPAPAQDDAWRQKYEGLVNFTKTVAPSVFEQYKQTGKKPETPAPAVPTPQPVQQAPRQFLDMTEEDFGKVLEQKVATHIANAVNSALTEREKQSAFKQEQRDVAVHLNRVLTETKLPQNDPVVTQTIEEVGQMGIDVNIPGGPSQFAQMFTVMLQKNILAKMVASGSANLATQQAAQQAAANQVAQPVGPSAPAPNPMDENQKLIAAMQVQSGVNKRIFDEP